MIKTMRKVSFRGPLSELKTIIEELKSTGSFELSTFKRAPKEEVESELKTRLARIAAAVEFEQKVSKRKNQTYEIEYADLKKIEEKETEAMALVDKLEANSIRHNEIKAATTLNKETITELKNFIEMPTAFSELVDTKSAFVTYGVMPTPQLEKFKSDFDLDNFVMSEYKASEDNTAVVIIGHKDDLGLAEVLDSFEFRRVKFDVDTTAKEQITILEKRNLEMADEQVLIETTSALSDDEIKLLKNYHDFIDNELDTESILASTIKTKEDYILNGWVPSSQKKKIIALIKQINTDTRIKFGETVLLDTPPVQVTNKALIAPYQMVTNMYGPPGKGDIDPNPFVAFFYFIFFGLMIGDVGYGVLLFGIMMAVIWIVKPKNLSVKNLAMIIAMGSVSAVAWGFVFGSYFGITFNPLLNPIEEALIFLGLALGLGVLHIMTGIALQLAILWSRGQKAEAILNPSMRLVFFVGLILMAGGMLLEFGTQTIGMGIMGGAVGVIVLTAGRNRAGIGGKIIGGFGGLYSFINYLSDILSYARLFGLGLVGAVIAMVANTMAGMMFDSSPFLIPVGIIVALGFHAFNLAIGLLSAYIHNARLQFIEFFSKFYTGSGKLFIPLGSNLRYTKIRSTLDRVDVEKYNI